MTEERWLPIVGWEGYYEVSDQGRIRTVPRGGFPAKVERLARYGHVSGARR